MTHTTDSIQLRFETESLEGGVRQDLLAGLALPASDSVAYEALIVRRVILGIVAQVRGLPATASAAETEAAVRAWLDEHLVRARYTPLYARVSVQSATNFTLCARDRRGEVPTVTADAVESTKNLVEAVTQRLNYVVTVMGSEASGRAVADHILADYIERLIHFGLGAEDAYPFLTACLLA